MEKSEVFNTFKRNVSPKIEYYEECYNLIIKKFEGSNFSELEEFLQYCPEMAKITAKTSNSINAIRGVGYKAPYEN